MKTLIAIVLAVVSMNAMATHDYQPNERYDQWFKLRADGIQWQTWSGNTGPNYEGSGVPAEFSEIIYMTLGGWGGQSGSTRCEYKIAAKMNPVLSAKSRATGWSSYLYDVFYSVNCPHEMYDPITVVSVGTDTDRIFIYNGETKRGVKAVEIQAMWDGMKSRYFSQFSGSGCTRLHSAISNYRQKNQSLEEYCF